jgi:hypothetical protein
MPDGDAPIFNMSLAARDNLFRPPIGMDLGAPLRAVNLIVRRHSRDDWICLVLEAASIWASPVLAKHFGEDFLPTMAQEDSITLF